MAKITAQYKNIKVAAEESESGIALVNIDYAKSAAKPNVLTKAIAAAIEGKKIPAKLDMSWATDFQRSVYKEMVKIKPGKVLTYKQLAEKIGKPQAYRAVASACARNKLPILIPCHRVVGSNGGLGGYSGGGGLKTKKYLLDLEGYKAA